MEFCEFGVCGSKAPVAQLRAHLDLVSPRQGREHMNRQGYEARYVRWDEDSANTRHCFSDKNANMTYCPYKSWWGAGPIGGATNSIGPKLYFPIRRRFAKGFLQVCGPFRSRKVRGGFAERSRKARGLFPLSIAFLQTCKASRSSSYLALYELVK